MKTKTPNYPYMLSVIFILCISMGTSYITVVSAGKLNHLMVRMNALVDDSIFFAYHQGYGTHEYMVFVSHVEALVHDGHLIDVLEAESYNVSRLESFVENQNPDTALVELRKIQRILERFIQKQHRGSVIITNLINGIILVLGVFFLTSWNNARQKDRKRSLQERAAEKPS